MAKSRTANTFYNFVTSIGGQFLTIILQFVVRTVFINTLGKSYLGISGLFSNILQMLSLAELGVGSAILFKLYDPLSKGDKKRIILLLKIYKRVYKIIGVIIVIVGLCLIPFLRNIISDYDKLDALGINAILIYILYLLKTAVSYFFLAYKSAIVKADQKEYKLNIVMYIVTFISSLAQILVLYMFNSFEIYVVVLILTVIFQNYLNARIAKKLYPYIDDKNDDKISKSEMINLFKDCGAIFLYKINSVVLKATDNIIISMYLGTEIVGLYSNYYILYSTIDIIFGKVFESAKHSLGNLHTGKNIKHEYTIFKTINFIAVILGSTAGIGIACVSNNFINAWIGNEWVIAQPFSILMGVEIFGLAYRQYLSKYRSAMGLFQQAKYRPVFGMVINLVLSLILVNSMGISGVLVGTIVADWMTIMWYDPYIIHKFGLKNEFSIKKYYIKNLFYIIVAIFVGFVCYNLSNINFVSNKWLLVMIHSLIICIIVPFSYFMCYTRTEEMIEIRKIVNKVIKRVKKNS